MGVVFAATPLPAPSPVLGAIVVDFLRPGYPTVDCLMLLLTSSFFCASLFLISSDWSGFKLVLASPALPPIPVPLPLPAAAEAAPALDTAVPLPAVVGSGFLVGEALPVAALFYAEAAILDAAATGFF